MATEEMPESSECCYPVLAVAVVTSIPLATLRTWYRDDLIGEGTHVSDQPRDGGLHLSPAEILAAATVRVLRNHYRMPLSAIKRGTSFLAGLSLADLELAYEHDQILVWAEDFEPQFVGRDHEIFEPAREPRLYTIKIRQVMPDLRAAIKVLDMITGEKQL